MGFKCNCGVMIEKRSQLFQHMKEVHSYHTGGFFINNFNCPICGTSQRRNCDYYAHLAYMHSNVYESIDPVACDKYQKKKKQKVNKENQISNDNCEPQPGPSLLTNLRPNIFYYNSKPIQQVFTWNPSIDDDLDEIMGDIQNSNNNNGIQQTISVDLSFDKSKVPILKGVTGVSLSSNQNKSVEKKISDLVINYKKNSKCPHSNLNSFSTDLTKIYQNDLKHLPGVTEYFEKALVITNSKYRQKKNCEAFKIINYKELPHFYYISLREIIINYLTSFEICEEIYYQNKRKKDGKILKNINDVERFRNVEREDDELLISLNFYMDDYKTGNSKSTKLTVIYCCIGNICYKLQSKRNQIFLLGVTTTQNLFGNATPKERPDLLKKFFNPIFEELKDLNNNPIILENELGEKFKCVVEFGSVNADNLALNQMARLPTGFNRTANCPYCLGVCVEDDEVGFFQNSNEEISNLKQTATSRDLKKLDHVFRNVNDSDFLFCVDLFHDLHEGTILDFMNLILDYVNIEQFVVDLENFHKKTKIAFPTISKKKGEHITGTGAEIINLFYFFPFINTSLVYQNVFYLNYLLLRKLVDFLLHPEINTEDLNYFKTEVLKIFKFNKINNVKLKPKCHHFIHYPLLIEKFGPLIYHSTLRFERVHQVGKSYVSGSNNTINLAYSVAQAHSYTKFDCEISVENEDTMINPDNIQVDDDLKKLLGHIDFENDVTILESTTFKKNLVEKGKVYLCKSCDNSMFPIFVKIDLIIKQGTTKVYGHLLKTKLFDKKLYSFEIIETKKYLEINQETLGYYKSLNLFEHLGKNFVVKNFHVKFSDALYLNLIDIDINTFLSTYE